MLSPGRTIETFQNNIFHATLLAQLSNAPTKRSQHLNATYLNMGAKCCVRLANLLRDLLRVENQTNAHATTLLDGPGQTTGSPSSLETVNMTLRNCVIIRVCMGI